MYKRFTKAFACKVFESGQSSYVNEQAIPLNKNKAKRSAVMKKAPYKTRLFKKEINVLLNN